MTKNVTSNPNAYQIAATVILGANKATRRSLSLSYKNGTEVVSCAMVLP
jgi:hypothetical protein